MPQARLANHGLARTLPFVCAVPLGWGLLLTLCALGLGALVLALPWLGWGIKGVGTAYLLWLAFRLARTQAMGRADSAVVVGFRQGVALQFVNIKAWALALAIVSGWVAGHADAAARLAVVMPVMLAYAFSSNLTYALAGSLLRNWLAGLPASLTDERTANSGFGGFASVETLSNGRTYGMLSARGRQTLVELPASGPLRVVKPLAAPMPRMTAKVLYENGDLGYSLTGPGRQTVLRLPLKGFDAAGDPVWSSEPTALASVPTSAGSPWFRGAFTGLLPPRFPVSASGRVVFLDQSVQGNEGFHLGAAAAGADDWLWQASPSGARAHPSEDHLLPLFTALGAAGADARPEAFYRGISDYVIAMDGYAFH